MKSEPIRERALASVAACVRADFDGFVFSARPVRIRLSMFVLVVQRPEVEVHVSYSITSVRNIRCECSGAQSFDWEARKARFSHPVVANLSFCPRCSTQWRLHLCMVGVLSRTSNDFWLQFSLKAFYTTIKWTFSSAINIATLALLTCRELILWIFQLQRLFRRLILNFSKRYGIYNHHQR